MCKKHGDQYPQIFKYLLVESLKENMAHELIQVSSFSLTKQYFMISTIAVAQAPKHYFKIIQIS